MQERLKGYYTKIIEKWNSLDKTQKIRLVVTVALILITLIAFILLTLRPSYYTIVNNRSYTEIAQIKAALDSAGIPSRETSGGTALEVNRNDADRAVVTIGTSTTLSSIPDFTYQDALDASGMGTTESTKSENNRRAYNFDLSRRLELIDGIEKATVEIILPSETNFYIESKQKASASAMLQLSRTLDRGMGEQLARFIKASVKGLELENIEIMSTNFETIYSGSQKDGGIASTYSDIESQRKQEIDRTVRNALSPIAEEVRTVINLAIKSDKVAEVSKTVTSPTGTDDDTGFVSSETVQKENVVNANPDAVPGVEANDQVPATYQTGTGEQSTATINNRTAEYIYNELTRSVDYSIGDIDQQNSSFLVATYKYKHYYEQHMTENNLLGDMTWQQFIDENEGAVLLARDDNYNTLRAGLIAGTGIQDLELLQYEVPVFHDFVREPLQIQQLIMFGILAILILLLAFELIRKAQPDEITEVEPELSVEDLLVSTQLEEEKALEEERLRMFEFGEESPVKALIDKFVLERPEAVAQLLRNWLNDEWE